MKTLLLTFLLSSFIFAQEAKFGVLFGLNISGPQISNEADSVLLKALSNERINQNVIMGNFTESGTKSQFEEASIVFDGFGVPPLLLAGQNEVNYNKAGKSHFYENFGDYNFIKKVGQYRLIGISSSSRVTELGFIPIESIQWLKKELLSISKNEKIILFTNFQFAQHPYNNENLLESLNGFDVRAIISVRNPYIDSDKEAKNLNQIVFNNTSSPFYKEIKIFENEIKVYENNDSIIFPSAQNIFEFSPSNSPSFKDRSVSIEKKLSLKQTIHSEPLIYGDKLLLYDEFGLLTAYDSSFTSIWEFDTFGMISGKPAALDNFLAVATFRGDLFTLDATTGLNLQSIGFDHKITSDLYAFEYTGTKELLVPKSSESNAAVILGTESGAVYCYDLETLEEIWVNKTAKDAVEGMPHQVGNKIIFTSRDGNLYCIDAKNGWLVWKYQLTDNPKDAPTLVYPVVDQNRLYLTSRDGKVYAMDLLLGGSYWVKDSYNANESIGISNNGKVIYVKSAKDHFHILDSRNGNWVRDRKLDFGYDSMPSSTIDFNGAKFFPASDGFIYRVNTNYTIDKILFTGFAPTYSVIKLESNKFMVINLNGDVTIFNSRN